MKKYRAIVTVTEYYEVYVDAQDEEEAEDIALENYGIDGELFNTLSDVVSVEEES
jgi:hypothetical protein